ncbi:hypothetical protein OG689_29370 [Kitasatospora sp. NBC_00240]|uniref:hypothetical protein n=1 Tax=Kitasatospora sp. NBC_00240 TaxID=2903567 RepID=UPI0022554F3B|nr:hypothetical protein [Kitasatospora sp. NBC_00240]MCX5213327.1 hypothetical protein [Kitasatospora sp. NBC_00240]
MSAHPWCLGVLLATAVGAVLALPATLVGIHLPTSAHVASTSTSTSTSTTFDGAKSDLTFDGAGAASGGGGNSRLLIGYANRGGEPALEGPLPKRQLQPGPCPQRPGRHRGGCEQRGGPCRVALLPCGDADLPLHDGRLRVP